MSKPYSFVDKKTCTSNTCCYLPERQLVCFGQITKNVGFIKLLDVQKVEEQQGVLQEQLQQEKRVEEGGLGS